MFWRSLKCKSVWLLVSLCLLLPLSRTVRAQSGTITDVKHVVILLQENRSFDHYFGTLRGVRGFEDHAALLLTNGTSVLIQPSTNGPVLPFPVTNQCLADVPHERGSAYVAWNSGRWDQWVPAKSSTAMAYYTRADLPFYYALADAYTVCDHYHCSVLGPTNPNRLFAWTGMNDPARTGGGPVMDNTVPSGGFSWTTYAERLQAAGITWRVYQQNTDFYSGNPLTWFAQFKSATPGTPLYDRGVALVTNLIAALNSDVTNGSLPQVSWIVPPWSASEHPYFSPASGEAFVSQVVQALQLNPAVANSTVLFFTYDENGGFFDHLPSPTPPPGTTNEFVNGLPIGLGARVPMIIVSPWTRGGRTCSHVFDHTSLLRFLERWTGVREPNISAWRREVSGDLVCAFDFANPVYGPPALPTAQPCPCNAGIQPAVPVVQFLPAQEPGSRNYMSLPYQSEAVCLADCTAGTLQITITNGGGVCGHFALYANAYRSDGPWQFDLPAGSMTNRPFDVRTSAAGFYDFSCYGPNGFLRRFAGNIYSNCNAVAVVALQDLNAGTVSLLVRNSTTNGVNTTITNGYATSASLSYTIPPGASWSPSFFVVTNNSGWYDLGVTASAQPAIHQSFAGRVDTGPPALAAVRAGTNLVLSYPLWAGSFSLETKANLLMGWTPAAATITQFSNRTFATLPIVPGSQFFRLRN